MTKDPILSGRTPLHVAAVTGDVDVVRDLLVVPTLPSSDAAHQQLASRDYYGLTPLHLGVRAAEWLGEEKGLVLAQMFIDAGADPNTSSWTARTPLNDASDLGMLELVHLLRREGSKLGLVDESKPGDEEDDLAGKWRLVRAYLSQVFWTGKDQTQYLKAYNNIYEICTLDESGKRLHNSKVAFRLLENLRKFFTTHAREVNSAVAHRPLDQRFDFYVQEWQSYENDACHISTLFPLLNRWMQSNKTYDDRINTDSDPAFSADATNLAEISESVHTLQMNAWDSVHFGDVDRATLREIRHCLHSDEAKNEQSLRKLKDVLKPLILP